MRVPFIPILPKKLAHPYGSSVLWNVARSDAYIWIPGCLLSFILGAYFITGEIINFFQTIQFAYASKGDAQFYLIICKRIMEGNWYFFNDRMGFPFSSSLMDFPLPETGILLIIKFFSLFFHSPDIIFNLTYLIGFPLCFFFSYIVLRGLKLEILYAFCASLLFTFLPYHFLRLGHLFLSLYFVIPLYFYYGYNLLSKMQTKYTYIFYIKHFIFAIFLSSIGVYYAAMGAIILFINGLIGSFRHNTCKNIIHSMALIGCLLVGICLNTLPNIADQFYNGKNNTVSSRGASESEIYGLKITQLLLPHPEHRVKKWEEFTNNYIKTSPLSNENVTSSLGILGSLGYLSLLGLLFFKFSNKKIDTRLEEFSYSTLFLILFTTIGGFSSLFALLISPQLRGWNRVSVFIGFAAISTFFLILKKLKPYLGLHTKKIPSSIYTVFIIFITCLGLIDQTTAASGMQKTREVFRNDVNNKRQFADSIEKIMPEGAALYQLPYMRFPGYYCPGLDDYELGAGFTYSHALKWSYGTIGGRDGDIFYKNLAEEPLSIQLDVIKKLGFQGIYIDSRGFPNKGRAIIQELTSLLGYEPELIGPTGQQYVFRIIPTGPMPVSSNPEDIMAQCGYHVDKYGKRSLASLSEGIDFTQTQIPYFLKSWKGISQWEPWGRWGVGSNIEFIFRHSLPVKFVLNLQIRTYQDQEITIQIGEQDHIITQKATQGIMEYNIPFSLTLPADTIRFIPSHPVSPASLGQKGDSRKLAIGFVRLGITK